LDKQMIFKDHEFINFTEESRKDEDPLIVSLTPPPPPAAAVQPLRRCRTPGAST